MPKQKRHIVTVTLIVIAMGAVAQVALQSATEAPTGFSTPTLIQNPGSLIESNGMPFDAGETFGEVQAVFEEQDGNDGGLGPLYNAQSCVSCHQNPVTGGGSQVAELRVGHRDRTGRFVNPTVIINNGATSVVGRSLINDRSTCAEAQERTPMTEGIQTLRMSLSILGDGFVEAISDDTLVGIQEPASANQRKDCRSGHSSPDSRSSGKNRYRTIWVEESAYEFAVVLSGCVSE